MKTMRFFTQQAKHSKSGFAAGFTAGAITGGCMMHAFSNMPGTSRETFGGIPSIYHHDRMHEQIVESNSKRQSGETTEDSVCKVAAKI